jgi:hypothetical protein
MTFDAYLPWTDMSVGRMELSAAEFTRTANQDSDVGAHLLFDVETDPGQTRNLAGSPLERECVRGLTEALRACHAPPEQFVRLGLV